MLRRLKFYPDTLSRRLKRATKDALAVAWVGAWIWAGWWVRAEILQTMVIADRIQSAGVAINNALAGLSNLWSSLAALPLLGSIFKAPNVQMPGDTLIALGVSVRTDIMWVALGAGILVALPPTLYVLLTYVPARWRGMREMGSALIFVRGARARGQTEQAKALLAYRALARLSFEDLMKASDDPIGDITARRYDGLATAMLEEAGLDWQRLSGVRNDRQLTEDESREMPAVQQLAARDTISRR